MLKVLTSFPVAALFLVLVFRGLSAPPSREQSANATAVPQVPESTAPVASSPYLELAIATFDEGTRAAANARAVRLFARAQQEQNAVEWMQAYTRKVAEDVAALRQTYGVVTGEAEQYSQLLNRTSELAAAALALHWLEVGGFDGGKGSVNVQPILDQYQEVFGGEQPDQPAQG